MSWLFDSFTSIITDFGADNSFGKVDNKLKEHYGIIELLVQYKRLTFKPASEIDRNQEIKEEIPESSFVPMLIVVPSGSFVPIVTTTDASETNETTDRRKNRKVAFQYARLCLAHPQGSCTPVFGGT